MSSSRSAILKIGKRRQSLRHVMRRKRGKAEGTLSSSTVTSESASPFSPAAVQCLQSSDLVHLIASYLPIADLLQASALSRPLHALFDSDAVWQGRVKDVEAVQFAHFDEPECSAAVLSSLQLASLPPLPSMSEVAALCLQSFVAAKEAEEQADAIDWSSGDFEPKTSRLTALIHLPSTLAYHARIITPQWEDEVPHEASYIEFELKYIKRRWMVARLGPPFSGWRAVNVADNVATVDEAQNAQFIARTGDSFKARYIDFCKCSEHREVQCHRLVPPSRPLAVTTPYLAPASKPSLLPEVSPLPLCSQCRPRIVRWIKDGHVNTDSPKPYSVSSVTRISRTEYDVSTCRKWSGSSGASFRVSIKNNGVVAHYGSSTRIYRDQENVCRRCDCALLKSGTVHGKYCSSSDSE